MLDRIALDPGRVQAMAQGLRDVAALPDPVREVVKMWRRPNGLQVGRMRIPLGVIGMIYEARPNVTADAAALCLKSGNAVILRGGSEAHHSNQAIGAVLREACAETRVPQDAVQVVQIKDHALVNELLQLEDYIDLIIPRGGEDLIRAVVANSKIPVIKHYKGICHVYVDSDASLEMAERICFNAKVQRPSVCNAMETLLVHQAVAAQFLPAMIAKYRAAKVEVRGCDQTRALVPGIKKATEEDWVDRVSRIDRFGARSQRYGRGDRSYRTVRLGTYREHCYQQLSKIPRVHRSSKLLRRDGQCVDALQRRRRVGTRRRDRHQHEQDPRLRAHGVGRADDDQVYRLWRWADSRMKSPLQENHPPPRNFEFQVSSFELTRNPERESGRADRNDFSFVLADIGRVRDHLRQTTERLSASSNESRPVRRHLRSDPLGPSAQRGRGERDLWS